MKVVVFVSSWVFVYMVLILWELEECWKLDDLKRDASMQGKLLVLQVCSFFGAICSWLLLHISLASSEDQNNDAGSTLVSLADITFRTIAFNVEDQNSCMEGVSHCCICIEDFVNDDVVSELTCRHRFHEACITRWLASRIQTSPQRRRLRLCPLRCDVFAQRSQVVGDREMQAEDGHAYTLVV
eukprot:TRINITY_DN59032_c0_g1_i1.p1 TRINITY_DN59032_c0_g1~~TRINITY_DN59032_c0_g1_i1.p1  ORF type:complete len:184 (+),score=16.10 TRINITY_DN59032_c0_g1_i1:232-783(+)